MPQKQLLQSQLKTIAVPVASVPLMKLNTMEKLYRCLKNEKPEIQLDQALIEKARLPIERMLSLK